MHKYKIGILQYKHTQMQQTSILAYILAHTLTYAHAYTYIYTHTATDDKRPLRISSTMMEAKH